MSKYLWIIDNGHGGIIDGVYQTPGKRSPKWDDGSQLFEGEFNRDIAKTLSKMLDISGIDNVLLVPELNDVSLGTRVMMANRIYKNSEKPVLLISIHANAGGGKGYEIFTSKGETKSDILAEIFLDHYAKTFPDEKMRVDTVDGDRDKEALFTILTKTYMPAILTENFFMDNEIECKEILMTKEGRQKIINAHFDAIMGVEKNGI